jgi:predicted YcjX-like family ATPase
MDTKKNYKVRLNSVEKIEELLQEIYDQACRQINEIQIEINKLTVSTNLGTDETTMDDKAKYAKAIHDYIGDKSKAIAAKFEIAKFMGELIKHNGDLNATANDNNFKKRTSLNLKEIRDVLDEDNNDKTTYNLKNNE